MFGLGRLLSAPVRILNAPLRAMEMLVDSTERTTTPKDDRIISTPLRCIADAIEEAVDGDE